MWLELISKAINYKELLEIVYSMQPQISDWYQTTIRKLIKQVIEY